MPDNAKLRIAPLAGAVNIKLQLLHVVRRYGPVGGMERYVWGLTLQLQKLGHNVVVLCEHCYCNIPDGITVIELGEIIQRPHWMAALRFDRRVVRWLKKNSHANRLVHSHERLSVHDITTFHSPPFATIFEKPWWRIISVRVAMKLYLDKRELRIARRIVPNSEIIKQQLTHYYPEFIAKLTEPITPGVINNTVRLPHQIDTDGGVIGFVGKEWKRKGLLKAVEIVKALRLVRQNLQFIVIGPDAKAVKHLFKDWQDGYILKGWEDEVNFTEFDVLLHPAKDEPYGMIISEAMAAKVPVVISDRCGSAMHVTTGAGSVIPLNAALEDWVSALEFQLTRTNPVPPFERSWRRVAQEYENKCMTQTVDAVAKELGVNHQSIRNWKLD